MAQYFENVKTLEDLKKQYRRLAMKFHPDMGGSTEIMQQINAEHDRLFEVLKEKHNASADEYHQTTETPEEFRAIIEFLLKLDGVIGELCGSWIWCSGNTKAHKEELKAAGCRWSSTKKLWSWHYAEDGQRWHKGTQTMAQIRSKYGSTTFTRPASTSDALPA